MIEAKTGTVTLFMSAAPFGTGSPSKLGGRCVDLSRELAARAREIAPAHFGTGREL